jgi:hypothetical protein
MSDFPIARQQGLITEEVSDEVLVYDLNTDRAHCLSRMNDEVLSGLRHLGPTRSKPHYKGPLN